MSFFKKFFKQQTHNEPSTSLQNTKNDSLSLNTANQFKQEETILDLYFESKTNPPKEVHNLQKALNQKSKDEVLQDYYDALDYFHQKTKHLDYLRIRINEVMRFDKRDNDAYAKSLSDAFKNINES